MKSFVRFISAVVLVMSLLLSLVACGSGDKAKNFKTAEFDSTKLFTNGLTAFKSHSSDKMGYIDKNGDYIIKPKFDNAYNFAANGLARVEVNNQVGYINASGEYVIEPKFGSAEDFDEHGMAHVFYQGKHGFIDINGNWIIENKYVMIEKFTEDGLARVCVKTDDETYIYGYIDRKGNEVIPAKYPECNDFSNGLAAVRNNDGDWGFVDTKGNMVIEPQYMLVTDFADNGLAFAKLRDSSKAGYIDKNGVYKITLDGSSTYVGRPFNKFGIAIVTVSGRPKLITETGALVTEDFFVEIQDFDENGWAVATKTKGVSGYINTKAEFVINGDYSSYTDFVNGFARVKKDGKWGFINTKGELVVECKYYRATDFGSDGYALVMVKDDAGSGYKYAIIDTTGAAVVDFK